MHALVHRYIESPPFHTRHTTEQDPAVRLLIDHKPQVRRDIHLRTRSAHPNPLSAISGLPPGPPNLEILPSHQCSMSSISPSRTPLLSTRDHLQPAESDGRKMKFLYFDTEGWTRDDIRRTITFLSAVLVGLGRWVSSKLRGNDANLIVVPTMYVTFRV